MDLSCDISFSLFSLLSSLSNSHFDSNSNSNSKPEMDININIDIDMYMYIIHHVLDLFIVIVMLGIMGDWVFGF